MPSFTVVDTSIKRYWIVPGRGLTSEFRYHLVGEIQSFEIPEACFFRALQVVFPAHFPTPEAQERMALPIRHGPSGFRFINAAGPRKRHYDWNGTPIVVTRVD